MSPLRLFINSLTILLSSLFFQNSRNLLTVLSDVPTFVHSLALALFLLHAKSDRIMSALPSSQHKTNSDSFL